MEYTKRRNLNRGYMKLDVWQRGMDLFEMAYRLAADVADFKLRSQFTDWTMGCTTLGSPSPRPSPSGSGRIVRRLSITSVREFDQRPSAKHQSAACCSLSLRERVRVRVKCSVQGANCRISQRRLCTDCTGKGSLAEALSRGCGLCRVQLISEADFESFDQLHYEVENKLLALITSIESRRGTGDWQDSLPTHP
jgi:hypothetical protein